MCPGPPWDDPVRADAQDAPDMAVAVHEEVVCLELPTG